MAMPFHFNMITQGEGPEEFKHGGRNSTVERGVQSVGTKYGTFRISQSLLGCCHCEVCT